MGMHYPCARKACAYVRQTHGVGFSPKYNYLLDEREASCFYSKMGTLLPSPFASVRACVYLWYIFTCSLLTCGSNVLNDDLFGLPLSSS